jgi:hypothetical protein
LEIALELGVAVEHGSRGGADISGVEVEQSFLERELAFD